MSGGGLSINDCETGTCRLGSGPCWVGVQPASSVRWRVLPTRAHRKVLPVQPVLLAGAGRGDRAYPREDPVDGRVFPGAPAPDPLMRRGIHAWCSLGECPHCCDLRLRIHARRSQALRGQRTSAATLAGLGVVGTTLGRTHVLGEPTDSCR